MKKTICQIALLFAMLLATTAHAGVKEIDRRTASDTNDYYLVFCARGGSITGHAFVVWGMNDRQRQLSSQQAFGMYAMTDKAGDFIRSVFSPIPGNIVNESLKGSLSKVTDRLIVRVDRSVYYKSFGVMQDWSKKSGKDKKDYRLLFQDCVTFTKEVSAASGLKIPARLTNATPQGFIRELMRSNN